MENVTEIRKCKNCSRNFPIAEKDVVFYEKMAVPAPTLCSPCRQQRRLAWRNEWSFYQRKCDLTGEPIISFMSPDKPQKVYSLKAWFSDSWDARRFGRNFDFDRPFFEQFKELLTATPHISLLMGDCENSEYTNYSFSNKNCYLISAADYNQDCFYSSYLFRSRNCCDCFFVNDSELCYECTDCEKCYHTFWSQRCKSCTDSLYCAACQSCKNCIGCINLRGQEFHILNKKYSKEEFESRKTEILKAPEALRAEFEKMKADLPIRAVETQNCQDCTGNNLINCKNCFWCFDLIDSQDCRYTTYGIKARDSMDVNGAPDDELLYECVASPQCYNVKFSTMCWVKSSNLTYCHLCRACQDCFGCVALYRAKYCILNKQYTKESFDKLKMTIIEHMKKTGEWGEFFPASVSPFSYNETAAQEYFPLTQKQAEGRGYTWKEIDKREYKPAAGDVLACENCGKNYKIIAQERKFYSEMELPEPKKCPDCRRAGRNSLRNPWYLRKDVCAKCGAEVYTSRPSRSSAKQLMLRRGGAPNFPEGSVHSGGLYCEKCYADEVY